ncbi:hypothetical protein FB451DRAFT_1195522 [Mycena latifolia]|nr:hypothetical protein FB451DRAFT_1195522 [Mycena latifolia]
MGKRVYLHMVALGVLFCVVSSVRLTNASLQSALQHFKQSIVLSRVLKSTLLLASEQSEHRYSMSQIFNSMGDEAALEVQNTCRMKDRLPQERCNALVHGAQIKVELYGCTESTKKVGFAGG